MTPRRAQTFQTARDAGVEDSVAQVIAGWEATRPDLKIEPFAITARLARLQAVAAPRLEAFSATTDGFTIAELDLQERGMGELAGARQSGGVPLRYANFATDLPLLEAARRAAGEIIARDPALAERPNAAYRERIVARYERGFELFRVG